MGTAMKQLFIFCALCASGSAGFSQVLFTYGNSPVSKDEFLRAYNKNKPAVTNKEKSIRDYLELYSNFKLKVKAARELRMDTIAQIKYDVQNFREQVTENYLGDEKGIQQLVDEAAARSLKDLHVLFFSVPVPANALPADTLKAAAAARELYSRLQKNTGSDVAVVSEINKNYTTAKYADAGFITAFSLPYEFENIVYNTKPGSISMPYRNTRGWYIFKIAEQRQNAGKWKIAQVLFAYPPGADDAVKITVKHRADSVYNLLQHGLTFGEAAKQYSDDRITYLAQGELPEFTTGRFDAAFESAVFKLKDINSITVPFETSYGYHIVKKLAETPMPADMSDVAVQFDIKQKVLQDARIHSLKEKFAKDLFKKTGFKKSNTVSDADLYRYADTLMKNPGIEATNAQPISKKTIITFKDGSLVKGDEWLKFVRDFRANPDINKGESNKILLDKFSSQMVLDFYKKNLEAYNEDFKFQMQEFKEGNMLFEVMEKNVWGKAGADNVPLKTYYNDHKQNYKWAASADVVIFNCSNEAAAAKTLALLKEGKMAKTIADSSNAEVQFDSSRYELSQIADKNFSADNAVPFYSSIIKNADGTAMVLKYLKLYTAGGQRSFEEARGLVINDYQNVLEQQWLALLKKKYPVKINEAVVKEILQ